MRSPSSFLECVLHGKAVPFGPRGVRSGIDKKPIGGAVEIAREGVRGDAQGDLVHHGGPDKAVHQYPVEHYAAWARAYPHGVRVSWRAGAFGENFSSRGVVEKDVCIGDVYRIGTATLQVTQMRRPCWKLDVRSGVPGFAREVQNSGRCGWYYRVLEPGVVCAGQAFVMLARPHPEMTLERAVGLLHLDVLDRKGLEDLAGMALLPEGWRKIARRRLESNWVEDWSKRLLGPFGPDNR